MTDVELLWDAECILTESPAWDARSNSLFFADLRGGRIFSYDVANGNKRIWTMPEPVGSFGVCESGRLVVALTRTIILYDTDSETYEELIKDIDDEPEGNRFNDGKVGPDGCFWIGARDAHADSAPIKEGNAALYRVTADGQMECKAKGYSVSNGLAWSADAKTLYYADSHNFYVEAWDFDVESGDIENGRRFATLTRDLGSPDGAACDVDGNYWTALVTGGCLLQYAPNGEILTRIDVPMKSPTMPCFADDMLYFTSKHRDATPEILKYQFNVAGLFRMKAPVRGAEVAVFAGV